MHGMDEWIRLHNFNVKLVRNIIAAFREGNLAHKPETFDGNKEGTDVSNSTPEAPCQRFQDDTSVLSHIVIPALGYFFENEKEIGRLLRHHIEFRKLANGGPQGSLPPHTIDPGKGKAPQVFITWHGKPEDVICLAHETAHALQIILSDHETMPPVARETCAFLGELAVIEYVRKELPDLFGALCAVWERENGAYLGQDLESLTHALADPVAPYHYRLNYPLARLMAVELFRRGPGPWWHQVFSAGPKAMRFLPIQALAERAPDDPNPLPALPSEPGDNPVIKAYRSVGAIALLDLVASAPAADMSMGDYYAALLERMKAKRVFLALDEKRRPTGYAMWLEERKGGELCFDRIIAPFCDHDAMRRAARRHAEKTEKPASSGHFGSATENSAVRQIDQYAAMGYALELLAQSPYHRQFALRQYFPVEIFPALRSRQMHFYLTKEGIPTAMITWAWLNEDVERDIHETGRALRTDEWQCGDRLFFNDWITPYGNTRETVRAVMRELFPEISQATSIRRNPDGSVRKINRWRQAGARLRQGAAA